MIERERSFDINKLDLKQAESLAEQIGAKTRAMVDKAAVEINAFLAIYGMSAKLQVVIEQKNKAEPAPNKKGRPRKQS